MLRRAQGAEGSAAPEGRLERIILVIAVAVSLLVHVGLIGGLSAAARRAPRQPYRPMEFAVLRPPPAPPPEPPKPKPEPPKPKAPIKIEKPVELPPPPNTEEKAPTQEPPKPVFGVSMSSVVGPGSGSSFSVRVGNTLMKAPDDHYTPPEQVKPYGGKPVALYKVSTMPLPHGDCQGPYPAEAKAQGIEGTVQLEITVLEDGSIGEVKVLKGIGHGLDEAAVAAMKMCKFSPATLAGKAVATTLPYKYVFRIDN